MAALCATAAAALAAPGGASVELDFARPAARPAGDEELMKVVTTGVGTSPEQARQNAFANAVEQVVGVLVDAETLIENERLVTDKVLMVTQGQVRQFGMLRTWQKDGLHYARLWALVATGRVAAGLRAQKIAVREIPGELLYRRLQYDLKNEKHAVAMLRKILADYGMDKLMTVEIVGKPQPADRTELQANLTVKVKVSPDLAAWAKFRRKLDPLLSRIATGPVSLSLDSQKGGWILTHCIKYLGRGVQNLDAKLGKKGCRLYLFHGLNATGTQSQWTVYAIPRYAWQVLQEAHRSKYRLHVALLDAAGRRLEEHKLPLAVGRRSHIAVATLMKKDWVGLSTHWLSPIFLRDGRPGRDEYAASLTFTRTVTVEMANLAKARRFAAYIAPAK
jgi:hypothetical protein